MSVTDSDGASDVPSFQDLSFIEPTNDSVDGTIADLSGFGNELLSRLGLVDDREYIDPLAPPSTTAPVVRRRHIFSNN